jgi:hypothetical protein
VGFGSFDDMSPLHPKLLALSDGAERLWFNIILHCNRTRSRGRIAKTMVPSCDHRRAWTNRQIAGFIVELTTPVPGFEDALLIDDGDFWLVHDYEEHQKYSTKQAEEKEYERTKKASQRARRKQAASPGQSQGQLPGLSPGHQGDNHGDASGTVPAMSLARDTRDPSPTPDPSPQPQSAIALSRALELPEDSPTRSKLRVAFRDRWEAAKSAPWPGDSGPEWETAAKWIEGVAAARALTVEAAIDLVLTNWFSSEYVISKGYPTRHFATRYGDHLEAEKTRGPKRVEPTSNEDFRRRVEAAEGKGAACVVRDV